MKYFNPFSLAKMIAAVACLCWSTSFLLAQASHVVQVTAPTNLAANYGALIARFGRINCAVSISGELALARDASNGIQACTATPIVTDLTGKIAVIDRGTCAFTEKVLNAQKKGAKAVLVLNNTGSTEISYMSGESTEITIPSFMLSQVNGNALRTALNNGTKINVTIRTNPTSNVPDNLVVWGSKPKEGEFEGGKNGWRVNTISCGGPAKPDTTWSWVDYAGFFPSPCTEGTGGSLFFPSPSRCNGFMIMNGQTLDLGNATTCAAFGNGVCPAPHSAELISPTIKVTKGTPLNVSFFQYLIHFYGSEYYVEWSRDGGRTWVSTQINEEVRAFNENDDLFKSVRLIGSENADSVKVKFRYEGNYYFWAIDDVKLTKRENNNLSVTEFYALSPNMQQPVNQAETIPFMAAVENLGAKAQTKLKLSISVIDSTTNARVFRDSVTSNTIAPNQIDTAIYSPKYSPNKKGTYLMAYQASADSADFNRFDNIQGFFFRATDTTFAKELGPTFYTLPGDNWDPGDPHSAAYGNSYFVVKGKGNYLRSVSFALANGSELRGTSLIVTLYKWVDRNQNALVELGERTVVAENFYDVKGTETFRRLITVPFPEQGKPPVELQDTTTYLAMVEYYAADETDLNLSLNDTYDRRPMLLAGFATDKPRYASFTALDADIATATYSPTGYGLENVYVVRMNVGPLRITSDRDVPSIRNEFAVNPNPARENVYLLLALNKVAKQANVRVMDMAGRQVFEKVYNNVQKEQFQISVNGLPSGTYLMQVTTEHGTGTKKFMVK